MDAVVLTSSTKSYWILADLADFFLKMQLQFQFFSVTIYLLSFNTDKQTTAMIWEVEGQNTQINIYEYSCCIKSDCNTFQKNIVRSIFRTLDREAVANHQTTDLWHRAGLR